MKLPQKNPAANRPTIPATPKIRQKSKFNGTNLSNSNKTNELLSKQSPKTPPKAPQIHPENGLKTPKKAPLLPLFRTLKPHSGPSPTEKPTRGSGSVSK
jgi:hypothetical protein